MTTLDGAVDLARDRELVERCQRGDESSFAELYDRYYRRLVRFCVRRLHSPDDAEEAVQEAFTRAWRALPSFGGDRRFYPWLTVIAGNVCTDILRRRARVVPMDEMPRTAVELDGEEVDARLLRQADLAMATEAFAHLSDRHQRVLRLREGTEWSAQRIAELEGVAVPAVDTLLWRARQAFKREFALLSDAGGLAGILGVGVAALRRSVARAWMRVASHMPASARGPGAIAATVALTGAAIAGGGVALVESGGTHPGAGAPASPAASASPASGAAGATQGGDVSASGARGSGAGENRTGRRAPGHHGGSGGAHDSATSASGLAGATRDAGAAASGATGATPLGSLLSNIAGIAGIGASGTSGSGAGANPLSAVTGAVTGAVGGVTGAVSGAVSTATGSSGTGSSTTGAVGTVLQTVASSTTLVPSPGPGSSSSTTGTSSSTGSSSPSTPLGTLLGGL